MWRWSSDVVMSPMPGPAPVCGFDRERRPFRRFRHPSTATMPFANSSSASLRNKRSGWRKRTVSGWRCSGWDWIEQLYVDPEHCGCGIGSQLIAIAKRERPDGHKLWIFEANIGARCFYERHDFAASGSSLATTRKALRTSVTNGIRRQVGRRRHRVGRRPQAGSRIRAGPRCLTGGSSGCPIPGLSSEHGSQTLRHRLRPLLRRPRPSRPRLYPPHRRRRRR